MALPNSSSTHPAAGSPTVRDRTGMRTPRAADAGRSAHWQELERKEAALWRYSLLLLLLLATAFAFSSWGPLRSLPVRLEALPLGIVILMALFGVYAWRRKRDIAELRGFVRGLQETSAAPPSEQQFEKLLDLISRAQHGYRDLLDSFDHLVFTLSPLGQIELLNRRFAELAGAREEELVGHSIYEFISEPWREEAQRALLGFLDRRHWSGVLRVRLKKSGELRYLDCTLHAIAREGKVTGISGLARDVTAQREPEERFANLFESLQEGVYFSTPDGRLLDANPALVRMLGYGSREELLSRNVDDLYAQRGQREEFKAQVQASGSLRDQEIMLKRKDGKLLWCLDSCSAVRDAAGQVTQYQGTLVDITARREMERKLRDEQEFVRRLVDNFPDAIAVIDSSGRYTFASSHSEKISGFRPEEVVGQEAGFRAHPEDRPAFTRLFRDIMAGRVSSGLVDYRMQVKSGAWRIFRAHAGPLYGRDGKIGGVIASARDVTESKKLEQQQLQMEKLAAMGQMIAGVAHELNNPLTAILGLSDLLSQRAADEPTRRHTGLVQQQARRAVEIVQNLLAFSRPAAAEQSRVRLEEIARRALQSREEVLRQQGIACEFCCAKDLPMVEGHPGQLMQVFLNLINNAEQAIREGRDLGGGTRGRIRLRVFAAEGRVVAELQDDGPGIPPENLPRIFDPFFTTKRPGGGAGLGLTMSLAVAKEHGGSIEAQSNPGAGSLFRLVLPAVTPSGPGNDASRGATTELRGRSVLVVDDEEGIRDILQAGLAARGMRVDSAATAEQALSALAQRSYDVVLCDFHLPGLSGTDLFERLRQRAGGNLPLFVFMSGEIGDDVIPARYTALGARTLQKPFQISEVAALIAELLEPTTVKK